MKRGILLIAVLALFMTIGLASATCTLSSKLVSQDPYPAVPGDYVKLVFQVTGMENPDCGQVVFQLVPDYPVSFDPGVSPYFTAKGGVYAQNYNANLIIPYKVRIDPDAVDGNTTLDLQYRPISSSSTGSSVDEYFNLSIQNVKSDFEVYVKNYDPSTRDVTFEILNIGKNDVDALTVQLSRNQPNTTIEGSNVDILGSLSSNDYTTADFKVTPKAGNINMTLSYNDITGTRRSTNKLVYFDPSSFNGVNSSSTSVSPVVYVVVVLVVGLIVYLVFRRHKKNKKKRLLRE